MSEEPLIQPLFNVEAYRKKQAERFRSLLIEQRARDLVKDLKRMERKKHRARTKR